jgi:hypothetical protein
MFFLLDEMSHLYVLASSSSSSSFFAELERDVEANPLV